MRVVGGRFKRRPLASVGKGDEAGRLRPTSDRVKESLFNVLEHGYRDFDGARVLDIFAGTGSLGIEAISRGAEHVTFVEKGRIGQNLIRKNIELFQCSKECDLIGADATKLGICKSEPFDICFSDPPYGKGLGLRALQQLMTGNWLQNQTLIVLEEGEEITLPLPFVIKETRQYGDTWIHIAELAGDGKG